MSNAAQTLPSGRVALGQQSPALALGPLDGRYRPQTAPLVDHLSEAALNRERVHVEVEWFIHLCEQRALAGLEPLTAEQVEKKARACGSYVSEIPAQVHPINSVREIAAAVGHMRLVEYAEQYALVRMVRG